MSFSRRDFLRAATISATASPLGWMQALAATTEDYRALVCVFLSGGNDGNNLLIPADADTYATYVASRTSLALSAGGVAPLGSAASQAGRSYTAHAALAPIAPLYQQGKLAFVANMGTLVAPMTVTQYKKNTAQRPDALFSHSDQQNQWQTAQSTGIAITGWGGRMADALLAKNAGVTVPALMSLSGSTLFGAGKLTAPLVVPARGTFGLSGTGTTGVAKVRMDALAQVLGLDKSNALVSASGGVLANAITSAALINPIMQANSAAITTAFTGLNTNIADQFKGVAKLIEARAATGIKRQVFFVSIGGFDTHSNQISVQQTQLSQLGAAMKAFYDATVALGISENVTTFTASDFSRTLKPNSGGTDHAWGNHQIVMGGAVKGGDVYGTFPSLVLNGPDDIDGSGRFVPTTSVDQYAATLASWFGVSAGDLSSVLPNLSRFAKTNLGFV